MNWDKWLKIVGLPVLAAGVITAWSKVGWETPDSHETDLHVHQDATLSALTAISTKLDVQQDEWKCDEFREELIDLIARSNADPANAEIIADLETLRGSIAERNCGRFKD